MKEYSLPFGSSQLSFKIPDCFLVSILQPEADKALEDPIQAIIDALDHPLGRRKLQTFPKAAIVGIAINDKTRPVPVPNPLDVLLKFLQTSGFTRDQITIYISSGTHTPMNMDEFPDIIHQEIIDQYKIAVHDCDQSPMVDLGETHHHTPIHINAAFFNSDIKITLGNIEPHHFMGFSGGVKTAAIGLANRETITANHAMLTHPQAKSGFFHINPMRQDIEEIGFKAGIHYTLGTILNEHKRILKVFFGDPNAVIQSAIPHVKRIFGVTIPEPFDLVIASPGGAPKDINLYQAQKGLTHAARITRDQGWVILLAACPEGSGSQSFEDYITSMPSHQAIIRHFQDGFFKVGPHKAFQIARDLIRINLVLVSEIPSKKVKQWKITPSPPQLLQPLIDWISARLPSNSKIALLPAATRTMPEVKYVPK